MNHLERDALPGALLDPLIERLNKRAENVLDHLFDPADLRQVIDALTKCREALLGEGWQPISTAPKDGTKIDLWGKTWLPSHDSFTYRRFTDCWWTNGDSMTNRRAAWVNADSAYVPTHWRELPPAPLAACALPGEGER